jgi:Domain of unknown function (DUF4111)
VELPKLPDDALAVADALRSGLDRVLGDNFASLFLYGAVAFPRPVRWRIDFDYHVFLRQPLNESDRAEIRTLCASLANLNELGADLDGYFVLLADAGQSEPPRHQLDLNIRDEAWALHRAHVHAGRYFLIAGLDPVAIVPEPTWAELEAGLRAELRFVNEHPEATAFGILNGCRILCSFENRDVVLSKYHAAEWALESLPAQWHDAIRAAMHYYSRTATAHDTRTLEREWPRFVALVNDLLPAT